jgi:DNA polymerase
MQLELLHKEYDSLQALYGDPSLKSIYGAGCTKNPKIMLVFMNPTATNVSAKKNWQGLRAPWLGTKNIWNIFYELKLLSKDSFDRIQHMRPEEWTAGFADRVYSELTDKGIFVTNLAKCTQVDARPLKNDIFKSYLDLMLKEIDSINPQNIVSFGNQVSSILLGKPISVGDYVGTQNEILKINKKTFKVYPTYYPVGQGRRNMPLAVGRIEKILKY